MNTFLAIISMGCIMFTMFNLGRSYEIMQEMKRDTKEWSKR